MNISDFIFYLSGLWGGPADHYIMCRWLQRLYNGLRSDRLREDVHYDGNEGGPRGERQGHQRAAQDLQWTRTDQLHLESE